MTMGNLGQHPVQHRNGQTFQCMDRIRKFTINLNGRILYQIKQ